MSWHHPQKSYRYDTNIFSFKQHSRTPETYSTGLYPVNMTHREPHRIRTNGIVSVHREFCWQCVKISVLKSTESVGVCVIYHIVEAFLWIWGIKLRPLVQAIGETEIKECALCDQYFFLKKSTGVRDLHFGNSLFICSCPFIWNSSA